MATVQGFGMFTDVEKVTYLIYAAAAAALVTTFVGIPWGMSVGLLFGMARVAYTNIISRTKFVPSNVFMVGFGAIGAPILIGVLGDSGYKAIAYGIAIALSVSWVALVVAEILGKVPERAKSFWLCLAAIFLLSIAAAIVTF